MHKPGNKNVRKDELGSAQEICKQYDPDLDLRNPLCNLLVPTSHSTRCEWVISNQKFCSNHKLSLGFLKRPRQLQTYPVPWKISLRSRKRLLIIPPHHILETRYQSLANLCLMWQNFMCTCREVDGAYYKFFQTTTRARSRDPLPTSLRRNWLNLAAKNPTWLPLRDEHIVYPRASRLKFYRNDTNGDPI